MMQRPDPDRVLTEAAKQVWSVKDFAKRHHLDDVEEFRLLQLFGPFASSSELQHNAKLEPRFQ
ncbi:MAG TPA: hypothetical protein VGO22_03410 [Pseudorhizobium sp.]|jgi:hypothetical protein|nr:hypothetical protein [Pseudorhizobium sp.]